MKMGIKGFMLAEVVVVSVVIATVLVTLFTGLNNVSSAYKLRNRYYDLDSLYVAMEINDILLRDVDSLKGYVNTAGSLYDWASGYNDFNVYNIQDFQEFYLKDTKDYIWTYITPYKKDKLLSIKSGDGKTDATFNEYLQYLSGNLDFSDNYDYIIIVERREDNNIDDCYYYALKLKY